MKVGSSINLLILFLLSSLEGFAQHNSDLIPGKLFRNSNTNENHHSTRSLRSSTVPDSVYFDLSSAYQVTSVIDVPIYFRSLDTIHSFDFALQYNDQKAIFDTLMVQDVNLQYMYYYNPLDSTLRFTSNSISPFPSDSAIVILRFQVFSGPFCSGDFYNIETWLNGNNCQNETINCIISGINETQELITKVFPIPCSQQLQILTAIDSKAILYDLNGKKVSTTIMIRKDQCQSMEISTLKNGVYSLSIENDQGYTVTRVVVCNE